jgi:hypothetical protein
MRTWMKNRLAKQIAVGTMAVLAVGGLAYAVTGPLGVLSSNSVTPSASPAANDLTAVAGAAVNCAAAKTSVATTASVAATAPSVATAPAADCAVTGKTLRALLRRTIHAQLIVRGKSGQWVTVDFDRGKITTISSSSITITRPDGVSVSAAITPSTSFRRATESKLAAGDSVAIVQVAGDARFVVALRGAKAGSAGSGKVPSSSSSAA